MAVEATQLNPFPPQLYIQDRGLFNPVMNPMDSTRFVGVPMAETQCFIPATVERKTSVNTDSGLTYNIPAPRKRSRDSVNQFRPFAGEDVLPQFHQYQSEIDVLISQHTKKIKLELEEKQKQHSRLLAAAIGEGVMKKLKEKDETIQRMGKINFALQERVRNLYIENQLLRDLAQSTEATANSLRTNLEQVLLHSGGIAATADAEDVESCCGSNSDEGANAGAGDREGNSCYSDRRCRMCGDRESSVLLLPCRHLCLCNVCGSGSQQLQACPVCNCSMTATLHVNLSS